LQFAAKSAELNNGAVIVVRDAKNIKYHQIGTQRVSKRTEQYVGLNPSLKFRVRKTQSSRMEGICHSKEKNPMTSLTRH